MQKEAFGQILNYARSIQNESQENFSNNKNKEEYKNSLNFALNRVEKERIKFSNIDSFTEVEILAIIFMIKANIEVGDLDHASI